VRVKTVTIDGKPEESQKEVQCLELAELHSPEMRKRMLESLEQARKSMADSLNDKWLVEHRARVLEGLDREIERLRAETK
jgi:hypothetical protein